VELDKSLVLVDDGDVIGPLRLPRLEVRVGLHVGHGTQLLDRAIEPPDHADHAFLLCRGRRQALEDGARDLHDAVRRDLRLEGRAHDPSARLLLDSGMQLTAHGRSSESPGALAAVPCRQTDSGNFCGLLKTARKTGEDQVIRENPASRGTEASAKVLVGPPWRMESNAGQQQRY
jgi:hypothetical protein